MATYDKQWRRYARSWQVLCPATEKIEPGAGTCLWYSDGFVSLLNFVLTFVCSDFYRAMHYSAKHGLAITCRLSVRLSVTLVDYDHTG